MYQNYTITAIIPAAGSGKRMNASVNKMYLRILGKTVLEWTVEALERNAWVDHIVVVVREEEMAYCQTEIIKKEAHPKLRALVPGGEERCDSVLRGLAVAEDQDIVLIHDGARPLVDDEIIEACIRSVAEHGSGVAGVPVKDTVKVVEAGVVVHTPDRSRLVAIHTPQGFVCHEIREDIQQGKREGFIGTDDASFVEKQGKKVFIVPSKYDNIKITTSEDLRMAEALLRRRWWEGTQVRC